MKIHLHFSEHIKQSFKERKEEFKKIIIADAIENDHDSEKDIKIPLWGTIDKKEFWYMFISEEHVLIIDIE